MQPEIFIATTQGVAIARKEGENWVEIERGLEGMRVTSIIAREGVALAGTRKGVFRYSGRRTDGQPGGWESASEGLSKRHIRWMAYYPGVSDLEFAGTEPAAIYVSYDGALSWRECPEVAQYREKYGWSLPYSPQAGCVRGFAFHGQRAYAAVEVGGVLVSENGGESWRLAEGSQGKVDFHPPASFVHPDVHSIEVHPSSADLVCAATGGGFYRSADGGESWDELYDCYCRAVWVDPADPGRIVLGPAGGVDQNGRIEESHDGGKTWKSASQGLDVPWPETMVERFSYHNGELLAVLSNGELYSSSSEAFAWRRILASAGDVNAVAWMVE